MNREQSRQLVKDTFTHGFQKEQFRKFIRELLNRYDEGKANVWTKQFIPDAFKKDVNHYERLGTYATPNDEKVDILIVHLTNEAKLQRARTALRNFVAHHLKIRGEKDSGLVAFVSPTEQTWRFSLVKMEYETTLGESGRVSVSTNLTPARRLSYLVGEGESCHTAQARFLGLLQETTTNPSLDDIAECFSVETVTKEFFTQYHGLFQLLKQTIEKLAVTDSAVRNEFKAKRINLDDFAKKLLGQIVFLYFLQKKGWLGVGRGKEWGSGPRNFLRQLADGKYAKFQNFFDDILEPLFYDTLANDRGADAWCKRFGARIPFLNGGLFEPLGDYDWKTTALSIPNDLFFNSQKSTEGDSGTGILDVFDRYNFTVNEAEPLEQEVAIDPEMLGKVFENLIDENLRKGMGTFYTPREIVHYMCQETLISYLFEAANEHGGVPMVQPRAVQGGLFGSDPKPLQQVLELPVSREDLAALVHLGDQAAHYEAALKAGTTTYEKKERPRLPKPIEAHARKIDEALRNIRVCDPAIGSGAFPVGMMTEIVRARLALNPYFTDETERTAYHFKRQAIHVCLYGADIDRGAVEIAKLRLWLSLVVDEEDVKNIKPLPNLDFKIVSGNSLLGFPFQSLGLSEVEKLKEQYFDEPDHDRKAKLKEQIDTRIRTHLADSQKSFGYRVDFDFRVFFSEVFREKNGFDVVIANPPYIDSEAMTKAIPEVRNAVQSRYKYTKGNWDIYIAFFETGFNHLNPHGVLSFITPDKWISKPFGDELRKHTTVYLESIMHAGREVFEAVKVDAIVTVYSHARPALIAVRRFDGQSVQEARTVSKEDLSAPFAYDWLFSEHIDLLARLRENCGTLSDLGTCENACATSDAYKLKEYIEEGEPAYDPRRFFQIINTGTIGKYVSRWGMREMVYLGDRFLRPVIDKKRFLKAFPNSYGRKAEQPKVIVKGLNLLDACLDIEGQVVPGKTTLMITAPDARHLKAVAAVLNNPLPLFYLRERYPASSYNQGTTFTKDMLNELPVPVFSSSDIDAVTKLMDKILAQRGREPGGGATAESESALNAMIYRLYGLSASEIVLVEARKASKTAE